MRGDTDLAADFLSEYFSAFRNHGSFQVLLQLFWTAPIGHDDRQFNEIGHSAGTYDNCSVSTWSGAAAVVIAAVTRRVDKATAPSEVS